jgi:hypothetical protein
MASSRDLRSPLLPARGLLHPAWLLALLLLALNDHVLKGSGLLPGVLTGKLSDFAGLFVAPLLLALVLRVRTDRGFVLAHVPVGVVFAAIQLSEAAAQGWSALMGGVGFPWVITRDPTDLVALPALLASVRVLRPALSQTAARLARQSAETAAAGVGLLACVATSQPEPDPPEEPDPIADDGGETGWDEPPPTETPWLPEFSADVYLHNAMPVDLVARIRALSPAADIDCDAIAGSPGALLTSPLLGLAQTWTLPPGTNQAVLDGVDGRDCHAALVEIDGLPPKILFWREGDPARHMVPGSGRVLEDEGEVAIVPDPDGGMMWPGGVEILHDVTTPTAECAPQADGRRLAWSEPVPWGRARLEAIDAGADGCWALRLSTESLGATDWFLCIPEATMVLQPGDELDIALPEEDGLLPGPFDGMTITVVEALAGPDALPRHIVVSAGEGAPRIDGIELALVPDYDCDPEVQPACGTVARPAHVSVSAAGMGAVSLTPEGTASLMGDGVRLDLALMHAQERFALDPSCALGPDTLGTDLELVLAVSP